MTSHVLFRISNQSEILLMCELDFLLYERNPLTRIDGKINKKKHFETIDLVMVLAISKISGSLHGFNLRENNYDSHLSKIVKEYLEEIGVDGMFWQAQSADLSPSEICGYA